ncbi:MAG TPA: hypothetical protein VI215_09345 [Bacteroidota bacterium]|jgi:hypothetical protein
MHYHERLSTVLCAILTLAFILHLAPGCKTSGNDGRPGSVTPRRDINLVKEAHSAELMALPGVVGVYVGALDDGKPCIGVMVVRKTRELEEKIPPVLEGYPVRIEETGKIKPMR